MKKGFIILLVLLLLLSGCGLGKPEIKTGWHNTSQAIYYLDENGLPVTGWQEMDGNWYYFHPDRGGAMATGWLQLPEGRYYFDSTGVMQTGWLQQYFLRSNGAMAVGTVLIEGKYHHFTSSGEPFLLINGNYPVPYDFHLDLVELEGYRVARECAGPLKEMMEACRGAGHYCVINSAYRDIAYQQMLWDNRYNDYIAKGYSAESAAEFTSQRVMPPGYSEHHTGLAVDITGSQDMYSWLEQHGPEYGFILRYPEGKTDWTGVTYEPWHFRYVGRELALELQANNLTVEEYLYHLTLIP